MSKAYYQQLNRAEDYPKLNQVIFLGFLNFKLFNENPYYTTRHLILDEKTNENHFQDFELNFVELPKFTKTLEEGEKLGYDKRAREMAKAMKIKGYPIEEISELTKIPKEEIERL